MFVKNCPKCGKEISYKSEKSLKRSIKNNNVCKSCAIKGRKLSEEWRRKLSIAAKGKTRTEEHKRKIGIALKGRTISEEWRRNLSLAAGGNGVLDKDKFNHGKLAQWSIRVRKRDQCCQKCNSTENLEAHHIINKAIMSELAYEEWNGITLCKPCHTYFHHQFLQDQ